MRPNEFPPPDGPQLAAEAAKTAEREEVAAVVAAHQAAERQAAERQRAANVRLKNEREAMVSGRGQGGMCTQGQAPARRLGVLW